MKKTLKILFFTLFAFILLSISKTVEANSINSISMDIFIDDDGNAQVEEIWNCSTSSGTEVYHPYYNLGNSVISDLTVSDGSTVYETLSSWNTSGTLSSKANKCGINRISNGVELCWGISSYGSHTYSVKYNISNFVSELEDSQMIYWTLIPYDFSNSIGKVSINIRANFSIPDSVGVWGYGNYGGTAYVYDGQIEMASDGRLSTSEYMTILVQFPLESFNCSNKLNYNFQHYLDMAEEGAEHYNDGSSDYTSTYKPSPILLVLGFLVSIIFNPFTVFLIIVIVLIVASKKNSFDFGPDGKKIPKDVPYFRDIPCGNLYRAYYIGYQYGILKNKTDILGAIILKWLKEGRIKVEQRETGKLFKKEGSVIILSGENTLALQDEKEQELFGMLVSASKDRVLENKEFEKWCSNHYSKILDWFDSLITREKDKLVSEGLIVSSQKKAFKLFKYTCYSATTELRNETLKLAGLKRYLLDYTLIKDREAIEVTLFEDYLIYAQMMGIAKKVAEEFKELYPNIIEQSSFYSYDNVFLINMYAAQGISHANSAKARAESYSSGGGGFSSGGGGGGSFGGGGGGGGFR